METPSRTCPAGGITLLGQGFLDPADYWDVSCTICQHVGTTGPGPNAQTEARALAARHLADGYRKPGIDPEPWDPTPAELADADRAVTEAHKPGGKFHTGPDPELDAVALRILNAEKEHPDG